MDANPGSSFAAVKTTNADASTKRSCHTSGVRWSASCFGWLPSHTDSCMFWACHPDCYHIVHCRLLCLPWLLQDILQLNLLQKLLHPLLKAVHSRQWYHNRR